MFAGLKVMSCLCLRAFQSVMCALFCSLYLKSETHDACQISTPPAGG